MILVHRGVSCLTDRPSNRNIHVRQRQSGIYTRGDQIHFIGWHSGLIIKSDRIARNMLIECHPCKDKEHVGSLKDFNLQTFDVVDVWCHLSLNEYFYWKLFKPEANIVTLITIFDGEPNHFACALVTTFNYVRLRLTFCPWSGPPGFNSSVCCKLLIFVLSQCWIDLYIVIILCANAFHQCYQHRKHIYLLTKETLQPKSNLFYITETSLYPSAISINYHHITVLCPFNLLLRCKCYNTVWNDFKQI